MTVLENAKEVAEDGRIAEYCSKNHEDEGVSYEGPVVPIPHVNDVLLGRGGSWYQHPGNEQLRDFFSSRKRAYSNLKTNSEKSGIARVVVEQIRRLGLSGRFLSKDPRRPGGG
ncbi:hypothetical protein ACHAWF_004955 [Thalassiosira exigua]